MSSSFKDMLHLCVLSHFHISRDHIGTAAVTELVSLGFNSKQTHSGHLRVKMSNQTFYNPSLISLSGSSLLP